MVTEFPTLCHRCGVELLPGAAPFYVVKIEAYADPTSSDISSDQSLAEIQTELEQLVEQIRDCSEQELMDQVHRRLTIYLCGNCYGEWIEHPAG